MERPFNIDIGTTDDGRIAIIITFPDKMSTVPPIVFSYEDSIRTAHAVIAAHAEPPLRRIAVPV